MRKYLPIRFSLTVILLPVVLVVFCGLSVAQAQRGSTDVLVTSTLRDSVSVTDPNTGTTVQIPMQIHGDGSAYNTITSKRDYLVKSVIQSIGDWELYSATPTRGMYLDLSQPIPGSGPNGGDPTPPFTGAAFLQIRFICKCHNYGVSAFAIPNGQSAICPLAFSFEYPIGSGNNYAVHMTPDSRNADPYPETDDINITCTGVDANNQCNQWLFEPTGFHGGSVPGYSSVKRNVGKLVRSTLVHNNTWVETNLGDFYFSFSFRATNP